MRAQPCTIDGVTYRSRRAAALALGMQWPTFTARYFRGVPPIKLNPLTLDGITYRSTYAAAIALGVNPSSLRWRTNPEAREINRQWVAKNAQKNTVKNVIARAKAKGLPFDKQRLLAMECPSTCPILGTPITFTRGTGQRPAENTASFDQIIPGDGYVLGNVSIISKKANSMKSDATADELIKFAVWVCREFGINPVHTGARK